MHGRVLNIINFIKHIDICSSNYVEKHLQFLVNYVKFGRVDMNLDNTWYRELLDERSRVAWARRQVDTVLWWESSRSLNPPLEISTCGHGSGESEPDVHSSEKVKAYPPGPKPFSALLNPLNGLGSSHFYFATNWAQLTGPSPAGENKLVLRSRDKFGIMDLVGLDGGCK